MPVPMHPIVSDIDRVAVTVNVVDPVPVTGPRAGVRLFASGGIGSKAALLHPQQTIANTDAAAACHTQGVRLVICRDYQELLARRQCESAR
jgi:hypothetical protein